MPVTSRDRVADTPPAEPSAAAPAGPLVGESAFSFHGECGTDGRRAVVVTQLRVIDGVCHRDQVVVGERQLASFKGAPGSAAATIGLAVGTAPDGVTPILPDEARNANIYAAKLAAVRHQHPNAFTAWTEAQDRRLADLHRAGLSAAEIGYHLGRQDGAVAIRLRDKGFTTSAAPAAVAEMSEAAVSTRIRRGRWPITTPTSSPPCPPTRPRTASASWPASPFSAKSSRALALVRHGPEYAGLLASVTDATALANTLTLLGSGDAPALVNALLLAGDQSERDAAVAVFARRGPLVARLQRAGLLGVETLFPESVAGEADDAFDRWLADALDAAGRDEGPLTAVLLLARDRGPTLRRRLAADPAFRARFPGELWPALVRACRGSGQPLELYQDQPHVWDVLLRPGGEKLLAAYGPLAVDLMFGPAAFPPELRDRIAHLLLAGYWDVFDGPFRNDPQFRDLLAAALPDELLAGAVGELRAAGADFRAPLAKF